MTVPTPASPQTPQWLFDKDGLYAPAEGYFVASDRLSETRFVNGRECCDLPLHLAEKEWVRMADFWPAFGAALLNSGHSIDPTIWAATYEAAEREAAEVQADRAERERRYAADPMSQFTPRSIQELRAGKVPGKP
jgi:hypothetical protein